MTMIVFATFCNTSGIGKKVLQKYTWQQPRGMRTAKRSNFKS